MNRKMSGLNLDPWDILTALYENTSGKPRKLLEGYMYTGAVNPHQTLHDAWNALHEQFASGSRIAISITKKVESFPVCKWINPEKLNELLNLCHVISVNLPIATELQIYNLPYGMRLIWSKLPDVLQNQWRTYSADFRQSNLGNPPTLNHMIGFIQRKSKEYSDPCYEKIPTVASRSTVYKSSGSSTTLKTETPVVASSENCPLHPSGKHTLDECNLFSKKSYEDKQSVLKEHKRCFQCLGPHLKKFCKTDVSCNLCSKKHPTFMHRDTALLDRKYRANHESNVHDSAEEAVAVSSNLRTNLCRPRSIKSCSKVVLVELTMPSKSSKVLRCYTILDDQSSSSFVDPKVANFFDVTAPTREYGIKTLTGLTTTASGVEVSGVKIKGVQQKKVISLPTMMTNNFIPNCKDEIATADIVSTHNHIRHLAKHFTPFCESSEVLVLIGRDCGPAMATQCFGYHSPYVHRTPLGWALVGEVCTGYKVRDQTVLKVSTVISPCEHWNYINSHKKPELEYNNIANLFTERPDDELCGFSKDDTAFLHKASSGLCTSEEGNIILPLPFRDDDVKLPDNQAAVYGRMVNTLKKIRSDPVKLAEVTESMQKNIDCNHVEKVPPASLTPTPGKMWYIPVFGVTHPRKKKIRLVFDSAATFDGISLNSMLLQGPDLNTGLCTVLLRFRLGEIGFTADIESMFYAFHLQCSDRDFTRFFWWKDNNPESNLIEYRATPTYIWKQE